MELIGNYRKVVGHKVNTNLISLLSNSKGHLKFEIKNTVSFILAPIKVK